MNLQLGKTIKKYRTDKNIKQEELADYLNISYQAVSKWETGSGMPDISLLPKLAIFFGVKIDDLFCIADSDTFERIDYMLSHDHTISDENFIYASRFLDERLKTNENDSETLRRYAELYFHRINRYNLAAGRYLVRAINSSPFDEGLIGMYIRQKESRWESPIPFLEGIAEKYPSHTFLKEQLVNLYIKSGATDKARNLLNNLRQSYDKPIYAMYGFGIELHKHGIEKEKAAIILDEIADNHGDLDSYIYYEIGDKYRFDLKNPERAIYYYKRHFESQNKPRKLDGVYSQAFTYAEIGDYKNAIEAWETIIKVLNEDYNMIDGNDIDWANDEIRKLHK